MATSKEMLEKIVPILAQADENDPTAVGMRDAIKGVISYFSALDTALAEALIAAEAAPVQPAPAVEEVATPEPAVDAGADALDAVDANLAAALVGGVAPIDEEAVADMVVAAAAEAAIPAEALPTTLTMTMRRGDGLALNTTMAAHIAQGLIGTIGLADAHLVAGEPVGAPDGSVTVEMVAEDDNATKVLTALGAGQEGVQGAVPLPDGSTVEFSATVGMPADVELGNALGLIPEAAQPREDGRHAINNVVDEVEAQLGEAIVTTQIEIVYTRVDGNDLTVAQAQQILNHPISTGAGGLRRLGTTALVDIVDGINGASKVAVLGVLDGTAGDIDPRALALRATAYAGQFDFGPGMGVITAQGRARIENDGLELGGNDGPPQIGG